MIKIWYKPQADNQLQQLASSAILITMDNMLVVTKDKISLTNNNLVNSSNKGSEMEINMDSSID